MLASLSSWNCNEQRRCVANRPLALIGLIVVFTQATFHFQLSEAGPIGLVIDDTPRPYDLKDAANLRADDGNEVISWPHSSCICQGKWHRSCPDDCLTKNTTRIVPSDPIPLPKIPTPLPAPISPLPQLELIPYIDDHPDHIDNGENQVPSARSKKLEIEPAILVPVTEDLNQIGPLPSDIAGQDMLDYDGEIVRHRKVYVTDKPKPKNGIIRPIKITIPVELNEPKTTIIDPPPPIFKMKEYTEYETKPQTVQVPVVTTIIRPKNVKKEQIISG